MDVEVDRARPMGLFRKRWFRLGLVAGIVLVDVAVGAYFLTRGPEAKKGDRNALLQAQEECLNYVGDPKRIVYSEEPEIISAQEHVKGYARESVSNVSPPFEYVYCETEPWAKLVREWEALGRNKGEHLSSDLPMVYLHELKAPSGELFLASVERITCTKKHLWFAVNTRVPMDKKELPGEFRPFLETIRLEIASENRLVRHYAARAETADGMAFNMEYEVGGVKGHIRGKYTQDPPVSTKPGDFSNFPKLTMEIVDGPLKP